MDKINVQTVFATCAALCNNLARKKKLCNGKELQDELTRNHITAMVTAWWLEHPAQLAGY
ncbi:MAG: hypothetical protein FWE40_05020 [Oscillospiraceae bacterium]|jgi:hypothetical protein|nr:hypothetical protein [Oscillospiraceae bacterium]